MFQKTNQGADTSDHSPNPLPEYQYNIVVRHTLLDSLIAVRHTITRLHTLGYSDPNDWSKLLPTGHPNEMMVILIKRVRIN